MNKTFWVIGNEIELSPEGLRPVMDIIDKAGLNDARQIAYVLLLQLMTQVAKPEVKEELPAPQVPAEPPTKNFTQYATLRPDLVEAGELPPLNDIDRDETLYLPRELMTTKFPCCQPDELEYQEYNLLIVLPNGKLYGAKTIDFEFEPIA
jgi:hypothetical protein